MRDFQVQEFKSNWSNGYHTRLASKHAGVTSSFGTLSQFMACLNPPNIKNMIKKMDMKGFFINKLLDEFLKFVLENC